MCLAQGHNAVKPVRLESSALRSGVKCSTTAEPLRSLIKQGLNLKMISFWWVLMVKSACIAKYID